MHKYGTNTSSSRQVVGRTLVRSFYAAFRTAVLPEELKGKTPEEVAAYYQSLLTTQKDTYEAALQTLNPGGGDPPPAGGDPPPRMSMSDFLSDPQKHTKDLINQSSVSREEFNAITKAQQDNFIWMAKQRTMEEVKAEVEALGGTFVWPRFDADIKKIVDACEPFQQTQTGTWKAAYYFVVGQRQPSLTKEAVTAATLPAEPVNAGGNEPSTPKPLSPEERTVAEGLGLTEDTFRKGKERMTGQKFPLTMDNRGRR